MSTSSPVRMFRRPVFLWTLAVLGLAAGALGAWRGEGAARIAGWIVTGGYVLAFLFGEFWLAWRMERAARRDPSLIRNSDLGRLGRVVEPFHPGQAGRSFGRVDLSGERWQACSPGGHAFPAGEQVVVTGRENLVLLVAPVDGGTAHCIDWPPVA